MSTERIGDYPAVELPDDFGDLTSWQRALERRCRPLLVCDWGG